MDHREFEKINRAFKVVDNNFLLHGKIIDQNTAAINQHAAAINTHKEFINKEMSKQILQAEKDIISHSIDRGKLYSQAILAGGYASFFAFWGFMKDKMGEFIFTGAGFFMAISLSIFIYYTVWQNISMNKIIIRRLIYMAEAKDDPVKYLQLKEEYDEKIKEWSRRTFKTWSWILILTIVPASIATALLFYGFMAFLLSPIDWAGIYRWGHSLFPG